LLELGYTKRFSIVRFNKNIKKSTINLYICGALIYNTLVDYMPCKRPRKEHNSLTILVKTLESILAILVQQEPITRPNT
jgi:hypothetical protein